MANKQNFRVKNGLDVTGAADISGELTATQLDINGTADISGELTATQLDINGTADISHLAVFHGDISGEHAGNTKTGTILRNVITNPAMEAGGVIDVRAYNDLAGVNEWGTQTLTNTFHDSAATVNKVLTSRAFDGTSGFEALYQNSSDDPCVIELDFTDNQLNYGCWVGIVFGGWSWRAKSVKIETFRNGAWQTECDLTNQEEYLIARSVTNNDGNGITKIKYTLDDFESNVVRVVDFFAVNMIAGANPRGGAHYISKFSDDVSYGNLNWQDHKKATFGDDDDLQIYHDSDNSFIKDSGTGNLQILGNGSVQLRSSSDESIMVNALSGGAVQLRHNGDTKIETASTGVDITGGLTATTAIDTPSIEVTDLKARDGAAAGSIADSTGVVTLASSVLTTTDINGGTVDNTVIGGTTPNAGSFTTLSSGDLGVVGDLSVTLDSKTSVISPLFGSTNVFQLDFGKELEINSEEAQPTSLFMDPTGSYLYTLGVADDDIHRYTLTNPFDVSSVVAGSIVESNVSTGSQPQGFWILSTDSTVGAGDAGKRLWVVDGNADRIREYAMSTAWDPSTMSAVNMPGTDPAALLQVSFRNNGGLNPTGVFFGDGGSKLFISDSRLVGSSTDDVVYMYNLSSPYDITSLRTTSSIFAGAPDATLNISSHPDFVNGPVNLADVTAVHDLTFHPNGKVMSIICRDRDDIISFNLSVAWDITTASYAGQTYIGFEETTPAGIYTDYTAGVGLVVGQVQDKVFQFKISDPALEVDAAAVDFKGRINVRNDCYVNGRLNVDNKMKVRGAFTGNAITGTGSINFSTNGGTIKIGGTGGTGLIQIGRGTKTQTIEIGGGNTESGEERTVNIGNSGVSGSESTINIGNPTAGSTTNLTINQAPGVTWTSGDGAPNFAASPGSLYTNTAGGSGTTLYVKESGTGTSGWVGK